MTYLIIAKVDENNQPTHINQKETQIEADAAVAQLHTYGDTDAFAIETPHARKDPRYMTVDVAAKTITYNQVEHDAVDTKALVLNKINELESTVTRRRLRDALTSDEGKTWVVDVEKLIAVERAKL